MDGRWRSMGGVSAPRWGFLAWFVVGAPGLGALGYDSAARWASNKRRAFASSLASDLHLCTTTMAKTEAGKTEADVVSGNHGQNGNRRRFV